MALVGDIRSFKLISLLQLITMEGKSGVLRIDDGARQAKCFFQSGRLYHCALAKLTGSAAFYELLVWEEGEFSFDERGRIDLRTVYEPIDSLLIQASKLIEEWNVIKAESNFPEEIFEISNTSQQITDFSMKPDDWKVLKMVNSKLNAKQIAEKCGLGYLCVFRILFGLQSAGIIKPIRYKLLDMTLIPKPHRGQSLFIPKDVMEKKRVGVETALQDLAYRLMDGRLNLGKIRDKLAIDQKKISIVIIQLYKQGYISLVDHKGNNVPIEHASIGDSK